MAADEFNLRQLNMLVDIYKFCPNMYSKRHKLMLEEALEKKRKPEHQSIDESFYERYPKIE